ncbi:MAG: HAD family phosphatase [Deltaproteobacteria bacterium]|nr:HAD family phosphatase [Deltaproteobacteria bacterium]
MVAKGAAFFDLDRTLIAENSGLLYARWERRHGRIGRGTMLRGLVWGGLYHLSLIDIDKAYRSALAHYVGTRADELDARTAEFFDAEVRARLLPGAQRAIAEHRGRGEPAVVLTNSSSWAAEAAQRAWGLDDWLANRFTVDAEGRLDGEIEPPICYGEGKATRAAVWCEARGLTLAASTFYTDSYSDLGMLEAVGYPVVVQPDPRLRRVARKRGWPILDWRA